MKSSCQIVFDALCVGESRRLLRCPPGSGEQSGFGISHSLNSQGLWPSADSAANSSLIPSPLLFGQLWIFERRESNSVRHATVQPHSVSAVVWTTCWGDLARTSPLFSFADHIRCQKLTVRWPKYNILDISLFPVFVQTKFDTDERCNGAPTLSKTIRDDREHAVHFKSVPQTPHRCCEHSREKQASTFLGCLIVCPKIKVQWSTT